LDLTSEDIHGLLDEFIQRLKDVGYEGWIDVYGGSAVAHYHNERQATQDKDSFYYPVTMLEIVAKDMAAAHPGLGEKWINNGVSAVMPPYEDDNPKIYYDDGKLTVRIASERYLLAMKVTTSRRSVVDVADAVILFNSLRLETVDDIEEIVNRYYAEFFERDETWGLYLENVAQTARRDH